MTQDLKEKRRKIVVANFKMNLILKFEVETWIKEFKYIYKRYNLSETNLVLMPPILFVLEFLKSFQREAEVTIGLQDAFWKRKGAFTGGVSASTLKSYGGDYVILGHSERKAYFDESEEVVARKIKNVTETGLQGIVCVGETAEEKEKELTKESLLRQLEIYFTDFPTERLNKILICYEPVWAISANKPTAPPTVNEIMTAKLIIKKFLAQRFGTDEAKEIKVLYGGSVDKYKVKEICSEADLDGVLVGKASLSPVELLSIVERME